MPVTSCTRLSLSSPTLCTKGQSLEPGGTTQVWLRGGLAGTLVLASSRPPADSLSWSEVESGRCA